MNRHGTIKDIRSKIKHENVSLGSGTSAGSPIRSHPPADIFNPSITITSSRNVGAGPSFVSLTPSDSISNLEARTSHGDHGYPSYHRPASPSHHSTASFAMANTAGAVPSIPTVGLNGSAMHPDALGVNLPSPLRPARSVRRPQQAPPIDGMLSTSNGSTGSAGSDHRSKLALRPSLRIPPVGGSGANLGLPSPSRVGPGRDLLAASRGQGPTHHHSQQSVSSISSVQVDRHSRSAKIMSQVAHTSTGGRETPTSMISSADEEDIYGGISPIDGPTADDYDAFYSNRPSRNRLSVPGANPNRESTNKRQSGGPLGSLTHPNQPAALNTVLSAFSSAGRKHQAARIMRGVTAEEESRRRRSEKKISENRIQRKRPIQEYVKSSDEPAFREINGVLRKVKTEWPFVADDDFNSVALSLSILDESSLGANRVEFEEMKHFIEKALQGTVDDHYESFATAITLHNSVLQSLTAAQSSVSGARRRLRDSREALGAKRADLVQMWQRSQAVKESLRLLDMIDHLKGVPDRLESLMAEKRFLHAVNLLVRSLKTIDKIEIVEVGATSDLRAYLKGQEQAMLEILIEELHNHLYLKSYFCDSRWKSYSPVQQELPIVEFGSDYQAPNPSATTDAIDQGSPSLDRDLHPKKALKLHRYLQSLSTRPTFDPNLASDIQDSGMPSSASLSALTGEIASSHAMALGMSASKSTDSVMAGFTENSAFAIDVGGADFEQNPEADSFLYIEMLLESLARLGKLGTALDTMSQRLAIEVHQLVDATVDEVDVRNEPLRMFSVALRPESVLFASSSALAKSFTESLRGSRTSFNLGNRPVSSILRISAGESSALQRDGETMRDLFWTLFSKLDAVLQGHRVVYEVAGTIVGRAGFKDALAAKKISGVGSLIEVWKPIQHEVRTLLHDYLMDDEQSSSSRNAIISVNDVLRDGRYGRDRSKQLFKLANSSYKKPTKRELGPLRRHEKALTAALKSSVPGLVSSLSETVGNPTGTIGAGSLSSRTNQVIVSTSRPDENYIGAGHRLLVKPDAFNVSVLFQPTLAFIERVQMVMPSEAAGETSKGFSAFLDEFVQDVFLPQLEDKVQSLFQSATGGVDAFLEDPASRQTSPRPVVKSVSNIIVLIDSLYSMLKTTPFHRESYSRLIITTIVQYYQKCGERFRDLVTIDSSKNASSVVSASANGTNGDRQYILSASWAQRPEINSCLHEMIQPSTSAEKLLELQAQENRFETVLANSGPPIAVHDMTTSRKKLLALGHLQHSLQWFINNISRLKATDESTPNTKQSKVSLSVVDPTHRDESTDQELNLPLSREMAIRYESLPNIYRHLSDIILFTLRIELRVRVIHYLDLSVSEGNYVVNDNAIEPSPHIVDLNAELANLDDVFTDTLPDVQRNFLLSGLSTLIDSLFLSSIHKLKSINRGGITKLLRNLLALQQNLKNIVPPPSSISFDHTKRFLELLYAPNPEELLHLIRRFKTATSSSLSPHSSLLGFRDFRAILNLALGIENSSAINEQATVAQVLPGAGTMGFQEISRQKLNEYLIELHEIAGESDDF